MTQDIENAFAAAVANARTTDDVGLALSDLWEAGRGAWIPREMTQAIIEKYVVEYDDGEAWPKAGAFPENVVAFRR
jgi:hypothetical protein